MQFSLYLDAVLMNFSASERKYKQKSRSGKTEFVIEIINERNLENN